MSEEDATNSEIVPADLASVYKDMAELIGLFDAMDKKCNALQSAAESFAGLVGAAIGLASRSAHTKSTCDYLMEFRASIDDAGKPSPLYAALILGIEAGVKKTPGDGGECVATGMLH